MGCAYALLQFCLFTFLVTMLVEEFRWSLVAAGGMATIMQVGGATGRVAWSLLADWTGRAIAVLVAVGLLSAACALLLSLAGPSWPPSLLGLLLVTFGFSIVGWNGLWMAEIARTSRPGEVGLATGGVLVFTYVGIVLGPATFATVYKLIGSYGVTYAIFSVFALIGALAIGRSRGRRPS
jgi:predicted MFS family arabinose efflux permease